MSNTQELEAAVQRALERVEAAKRTGMSADEYAREQAEIAALKRLDGVDPRIWQEIIDKEQIQELPVFNTQN